MSIRYLGCVEAGGVSYENINMDQINSLCSEGFAKVRILQFFIRILSFFRKTSVIRALIISRQNTNLARDILQVKCLSCALVDSILKIFRNIQAKIPHEVLKRSKKDVQSE